jgi:hypothetical protein
MTKINGQGLLPCASIFFLPTLLLRPCLAHPAKPSVLVPHFSKSSLQFSSIPSLFFSVRSYLSPIFYLNLSGFSSSTITVQLTKLLNLCTIPPFLYSQLNTTTPSSPAIIFSITNTSQIPKQLTPSPQLPSLP